MKKIKRNYIYIIVGLMLAAGTMLSGCAKKQQAGQSNQGFTAGQVMAVAASEKMRYEQLFSEGIWSVKADGDKLYKDVLKEQIHEFCDRIVLIDSIAEDQGIALDEDDAVLARESADEYYGMLSDAEKAAMGLTGEECRDLFAKYALADETALRLSTDMNLEVSENEAKVIRVIEAKSEDSERLNRFVTALETGDEDFLTTAGKIGVKTEERLLGRKEETPQYEEIAFALKDDEVSPVFRKGEALVVLYCVNDYDEKATAERKALIFQERQKRGFEKLIEEYSKGVTVKYDTDIWGGLDIAEIAAPETADFFEIFGEYREKVGR